MSPLMAHSGHRRDAGECLLLGAKQTSQFNAVMSAYDRFVVTFSRRSGNECAFEFFNYRRVVRHCAFILAGKISSHCIGVTREPEIPSYPFKGKYRLIVKVELIRINPISFILLM